MIRSGFSGAAVVAGVIGSPVRHSLSPLIHNAWIAAAGLDAVYAPFEAAPSTFADAVRGLCAAGVRGLNVTLPFKEAALAIASRADAAARVAGAANLLLFGGDGLIEARNTDGAGLLHALQVQAPGWRAGAAPVLILGAGGAARGAAAALRAAGAKVMLSNRTAERAQALADALGGVHLVAWTDLGSAVAAAGTIVNATSAGLAGHAAVDLPLHAASPSAVVVDMVYSPLRTPLLREAAARGLRTVDGLAMLIGQAAPSFEALFGAPPAAGVNVRGLALGALGEDGP